MTFWFPETKTGLRFGLASAAVTGCLAVVLLAGLPLRAEDANPVLAKVNGSEIRQVLKSAKATSRSPRRNSDRAWRRWIPRPRRTTCWRS